MNATLTSLLMYPGISLAEDLDSIFKVTNAKQGSYSGLKRRHKPPLEDNANLIDESYSHVFIEGGGNYGISV